MEIGNGGMPGFDIPKYEGDAVKDKPCEQGKEADFCQQFPQEDNEEEVLKGRQQIEGKGKFEKPNVHRIGPLRYGLMNSLMLSCFYQNFDWVSTDPEVEFSGPP